MSFEAELFFDDAQSIQQRLEMSGNLCIVNIAFHQGVEAFEQLCNKFPVSRLEMSRQLSSQDA